eukprot:6704913-Lingulodinium_polyedra.AAC.1
MLRAHWFRSEVETAGDLAVWHQAWGHTGDASAYAQLCRKTRRFVLGVANARGVHKALRDRAGKGAAAGA